MSCVLFIVQGENEAVLDTGEQWLMIVTKLGSLKLLNDKKAIEEDQSRPPDPLESP